MLDCQPASVFRERLVGRDWWTNYPKQWFIQKEDMEKASHLEEKEGPMAKKSCIIKNEKRKEVVKQYAQQRTILKEVIRNPGSSLEERMEAQRGLQALPRNASPSRVRNRCLISGRTRGFLKRFGMSRIDFRLLALRGGIPGVRKSSW